MDCREARDQVLVLASTHMRAYVITVPATNKASAQLVQVCGCDCVCATYQSPSATQHVTCLATCQVGKKARNAPFGACFESEHASEGRDPLAFVARPGRRLWVSDPFTGDVSSTLKFTVTDPPPFASGALGTIPSHSPNFCAGQ